MNSAFKFSLMGLAVQELVEYFYISGPPTWDGTYVISSQVEPYIQDIFAHVITHL